MSAGFGEIAPAVETINIRGTDIVMRGLPTADIFDLWSRFSAAGRELEKRAKDGNVDFFEFVGIFPDAVSAFLAAGLGHKGNKDVERQARENLTPGDQGRLLEALIRVTFAEGYGPFVKIAKAMGYANAEKIIQALTEQSSPSSSITESTSLKPAA